MAFRIPFNKPCIAGNEMEYMAQAVRRGHLSGDGGFSRMARELLESELGVSRALLTTSCTHALEMMALLLDLQPGDEVILPSFTFVSSANAFVLRGATPRFVDIRPDTLNLDERLLAAAITPRTKAIIPVHYAGVGCEMDRIVELARERGVAVVEDNAHGLFGRYRGKLLGTFGPLAAQSFHETKNIICGEGGALMISDSAYIDRAEYIREKGTNRNRFFRGQVDKYTWVDVGSSYVLSDLLAAFLYGQLERRRAIQERRAQIWKRYAAGLDEWAADQGIRLPFIPPHCEQPYHTFYLVLPTLEDRQALIAHLKERGILAVFHYLPLHLSEMGKKFGGCPGQCPVTEYISDRLLRLPFYNDLSPIEQDDVIEAVKAFRVSRQAALAEAG
jgi:dTDP-4-amino-4,6-dideoxygalactose transaminase